MEKSNNLKAEIMEIQYSKSQKKYTEIFYTLFWLGFILYASNYVIYTTGSINPIYCQVFQLIGIFFLILSTAYLIEFKFDNSYLKYLFLLYLLWLLVTISRNNSLEYSNLKLMLFGAESGVLLYFVPLILLFPKNILVKKSIFYVISILGFLFILFTILFYDKLLNLDQTNDSTKFVFEYFTKILGIPAGFILLTFPYHSKRKNILAFVVTLMCLAFAIYRARRGLIFIISFPILLSFIIYYFYSSRLTKLYTILLLPLLYFAGIDFFNKIQDDGLGLLTDRLYEDTRSGVENCFFSDMTMQDWIIGKGYNGQYFCPNVDLNDTTGYRIMIETDYLNIILKGGIVSLCLLMLILIPAIYKGLFNSNNILSKASSLWILLWIFSLYPATVNTFSLNYILVWISTGICYSNKIRNLTDDEIKVKLYL